MQSLDYLVFDYSEDTEGMGTLEAAASIWPEQVPAVQAELARVLDWAFTAFAGQRGPLEEGGDWDYDLQGLLEFTASQAVQYDELMRRFSVAPGPPGKPRHTYTLALSGTGEFCAAFRAQFGLDAPP
ncbi:MAG: hypothetical protein Q7K20_05385 [Polaromonas sp.]|nr:hypothetical protein [Polaromonas sp.]